MSFCATDTSGNYNIFDQRFDTRFYSGTEHNDLPDAGSAAWPNPPGGNWGAVLEVIIENAITNLSSLADFAYTAQEVKGAYEEEDFDVEEMDHIEFEANYRWYTRTECSHSVNFVADQVPGSSGMVDILSVTSDAGIDDVGPYIYLYPEDDEIPEPSHHDTSSTSTATTSESSGGKTPYMDMFDAMSTSELADYGVKRIPPGQAEQIAPHHTPNPSDRATYVTSFNPTIEFGAQNGVVVETEITEY